MKKTKYRYMVFDLNNQDTPAYVGAAKDIARKLFVDSSCIHKAAKNGKNLMNKYLVIREEIN